ncbi:hypothetical protein GCK72_020557 [Caenorhabditis remanei]|uniref:glucuronosyltransferase n=1 Tax=Caenorhabditis remanei TaxID=31234 RepID=A0A6A5GHS7_CAERE|nr:hypothetical protein GCK72_020557 [Caenorhabditis remanei]KAF1753999.1 hypothetical protein GCK72_020557 [Caenorhabditis remanei]
MLAKTIQVRGLTVDVKKLRSEKLDEKWNKILESRPHSILFSFGTMFKSIYMPESYKQNFVKVMKSFQNVTFIWKYESEETSFSQGAENIVFTDSRLSAFLTHGGLGSVNELSYLGKPAILCPLFADQLRNAKMLARHNGAIEISKFDLADYKT